VDDELVGEEDPSLGVHRSCSSPLDKLVPPAIEGGEAVHMDLKNFNLILVHRCNTPVLLETKIWHDIICIGIFVL
jgi:hypothetical protein